MPLDTAVLKYSHLTLTLQHAWVSEIHVCLFLIMYLELEVNGKLKFTGKFEMNVLMLLYELQF